METNNAQTVTQYGVTYHVVYTVKVLGQPVFESLSEMVTLAYYRSSPVSKYMTHETRLSAVKV